MYYLDGNQLHTDEQRNEMSLSVIHAARNRHATKMKFAGKKFDASDLAQHDPRGLASYYGITEEELVQNAKKYLERKIQKNPNDRLTRTELEELKRWHVCDGTRSFQLEGNGGYTAIVYDLFRRMHAAAISYVNRGATDFNSESLLFGDDIFHSPSRKLSATDKHDLDLFIKNDPEAMKRFCEEGRVLPPSVLLALYFKHPTEAWSEHHVPLSGLHSMIEEANDILYTYSHLKARGLDQEAIDGYLNRLSNSKEKELQKMAERIKHAFKQMDFLLKFDERKRFDELDATRKDPLPKPWGELRAQAVAAYKAKISGKPTNGKDSKGNKKKTSTLRQRLGEGVKAAISWFSSRGKEEKLAAKK